MTQMLDQADKTFKVVITAMLNDMKEYMLVIICQEISAEK